MDQISFIFDILKTILYAFVYYWWLYLPVLLFLAVFVGFEYHNKLKYFQSMKWVLLETKFPKDLHRSPKAAEQVFAGLHAIAIPIKWYEKFFKGKIPDWFSFEIVGVGGESHFYVRTPEQYKNLVEAQIYAQYSEAEIVEVPDYVEELPKYLPDEKYDIWGAELILDKEDAYPIRTYPDFEEKGGGLEDIKRIDPLSSLMELMSMLHPGERIWIQLIIRPAGEEWVKSAEAVVDKILGKTPKPSQESLASKIVFGIDKAITSAVPSSPNALPVREERKERVELTPGKQAVVKEMERGLAKFAYYSGIRFLYIAPRESYHRAHVAGILGTYKQFSTHNLNGFKMNKLTMTTAKWLFKNMKEFKKKLILYTKYRQRRYPLNWIVLNIEELATIYHFPDVGVRAPMLPRVQAKKGEPPVGLPVT